jgi:hypothetical protein
LVAVVAAAAGVLAVLDVDGEQSSLVSTPPTEGEPLDLSRLITTPPTLPPPATLPLAEPPLASAAPPGPAATTNPPFPPVWRAPAAALVEFDLATAVDDLDDDVARRSITRYALGDHLIDAVIVHDPFDGRDEVVLTSGAARLRFVIDRGTSTVYLDRTTNAVRDQAGWASVGGDRFVRPPPGVTLADWIDRLLLGPIRPATAASSTITASDSLTLLDARIPVARLFDVGLDRGVATEWVDFPFDAIGVAPSTEPVGGIAEFQAFVAQGSELILVSGKTTDGAGSRTFTHQLERLATRTAIDLPADALPIRIDVAPASS